MNKSQKINIILKTLICVLIIYLIPLIYSYIVIYKPAINRHIEKYENYNQDKLIDQILTLDDN